MRWLEDIPPEERPVLPGNNLIDWHAVAKELRARPWKWAIVADDVVRSTGTKIKQGIYRAFQPPSDYEVTATGPRDGRVSLIMRYVGCPRPQDADDDLPLRRGGKKAWPSR